MSRDMLNTWFEDIVWWVGLPGRFVEADGWLLMPRRVVVLVHERPGCDKVARTQP
jgi:hypothetical protein